MADETPTADPIATDTNGADNQPMVQALTQYVKDLSAESPNAPHVFQWQAQPQVDVQFNINVDKIADDVHEVVLRIELNAKSDQGAHFLVDLSYAGLFGIRNVPDEAMAPFLLIEAPRLLFPFARQIVADAVQNTGFPPLLLEPINFEAAFVQRMEAAQAEAEANGGEPSVTDTPAGNA